MGLGDDSRDGEVSVGLGVPLCVAIGTTKSSPAKNCTEGWGPACESCPYFHTLQGRGCHGNPLGF